MDIPDADKRAVIAEIKAQYKVAKADARSASSLVVGATADCSPAGP